MSTSRSFIALALVCMAVLSAPAEPHCPANVASLRFPASPRSQIIVPVTINRSLTYEFLVDTGSQFTIVDPALVSELHLPLKGRAELAGVGFKVTAALAQVDSLQVGSQVITNQVIEVQDLKRLQSADLHFRGVLGGLFLQHFDVLIDYAHGLLCLDRLNSMRSLVRGVRLELPAASTPLGAAPTAGLVILPVRLSGAGPQLLHLALDSGSNLPFLYKPNKYLPVDFISRATVSGQAGNGTKQEFGILPSQNIEIGSLRFQQLSFVIPRRSDPDAPVDGLLAADLFRTVFISYADHFVVLDPP